MIANKSIKNLIALAVVTPFLLLASPAFADDTAITNTVKTNISNNATTGKSDISVDTEYGVVKLKGTVDTQDEAIAAITEASSVSDVKDVDTTDLKVKGETGAQTNGDAYITAAVKGAFVREKVFGDKSIDAVGMSVTTKDGVVSLSGTADNAAQIDTAVSLVKNIKGVKNVQSTVQVKQQ